MQTCSLQTDGRKKNTNSFYKSLTLVHNGAILSNVCRRNLFF